MIPTISGTTIDQIEFVRQPSLDYKFGGVKSESTVDGLEAVTQAVEIILKTERRSLSIYDNNFGMEMQKYIGMPFHLLQAGIGIDLQEALLQDDRITSVDILGIIKTSIDACQITMQINTIYGNKLVESEVILSV